MTDQVVLAATLTSLANGVNSLTLNQTNIVVLDPFTGGNPFDLSTRSVSAAYKLLSKPLDEPWNSTVETFPAFIIALRLRAGKGKWNAMRGTPPSPIASNIITIAGHNILTDYHSVTDAEVDTSSITHTDDRDIQNSSAFSNA